MTEENLAANADGMPMDMKCLVVMRASMPRVAIGRAGAALLGANSEIRTPSPAVHTSDIRLGAAPSERVVKLLDAKYADMFFRTGELQLGSFPYYQAHDHPAVGDPSEATFVVAARNNIATSLAQIAGGENHWLYCCRMGAPSPSDLSSHSADAGIWIRDVRRFAEGVAHAVGAKSYSYGCCLYRECKVIVDDVPEDYPHHIASARQLDLANYAKYFVKPAHLSYQREFRFIFRMPSALNGVNRLRVPEAISFCERLF